MIFIFSFYLKLIFAVLFIVENKDALRIDK